MIDNVWLPLVQERSILVCTAKGRLSYRRGLYKSWSAEFNRVDCFLKKLVNQFLSTLRVHTSVESHNVHTGVVCVGMRKLCRSKGLFMRQKNAKLCGHCAFKINDLCGHSALKKWKLCKTTVNLSEQARTAVDAINLQKKSSLKCRNLLKLTDFTHFWLIRSNYARIEERWVTWT